MKEVFDLRESSIGRTKDILMLDELEALKKIKEEKGLQSPLLKTRMIVLSVF